MNDHVVWAILTAQFWNGSVTTVNIWREWYFPYLCQITKDDLLGLYESVMEEAGDA
jgi:hypothetical protein